MMSNIIFTDYPGHGLALLLFIAVTIISVLSFRTSALRRKPILRWILFALSCIIVFLLILLTWSPSRVHTTEQKEQNTLLVCFDTSESMSVIEGEQSRVDQALAVFDQRFLKGRQDRPRCRWYGFDNDFRIISRADLGEKWGDRSNLESALTKLNDYVQTDRQNSENNTSTVCGAIIFTDGQADEKNASIYPRWRSGDCPLMIVGCGDARPFKDIVVKTVKTPLSVRVEQSYEIIAHITTSNIDGQQANVQLWVNDVLSEQTPVIMSQSGGQQEVRFSTHALKSGIDHVKVVAEAVDGEANTHNNGRTRLVKILPDNTMKALFYSQVASFDIGRVRQCLTRDARVNIDFLSDAVIDPELNKDHTDRLLRFPANATEFKQYDLIVLGPCRFDEFSDEQIEGLYDFVTKGGGSLIFLAGRDRFGLEECTIDKILALVPAEFGSRMNWVTAHGLSITEEGRDQSYSEAVCRESRAEDIEAAYPSLKKKPAASTVIKCGQQALVCTQRIGRGRTAFINSRNIYQIYREDEEDGPLFTLLSDIVTDIAGQSGRQNHIEAFVQRSQDGPDLIFEAFVTDQDFAPAQRATVLLEFNDNITTMRETTPGTYMATIPDFKGNSVFARVSAEHRGLYLGEKSLASELEDIRLEMDDTRCDKEFLRTLCDHVGAEYVDVEKLASTNFDRFKSYRAVAKNPQLQRIRPGWGLLALLCSILVLQWFLRRAKGLI